MDKIHTTKQTLDSDEPVLFPKDPLHRLGLCGLEQGGGLAASTRSLKLISVFADMANASNGLRETSEKETLAEHSLQVHLGWANDAKDLVSQCPRFALCSAKAPQEASPGCPLPKPYVSHTKQEPPSEEHSGKISG